MSDSARSAISATSLRIWFFVCSSRPGSMVSSGMVAPGGKRREPGSPRRGELSLDGPTDAGQESPGNAAQAEHLQRDAHGLELPDDFFRPLGRVLPPGPDSPAPGLTRSPGQRSLNGRNPPPRPPRTIALTPCASRVTEKHPDRARP